MGIQHTSYTLYVGSEYTFYISFNTHHMLPQDFLRVTSNQGTAILGLNGHGPAGRDLAEWHRSS
jgi:hypothetical protein